MKLRYKLLIASALTSSMFSLNAIASSPMSSNATEVNMANTPTTLIILRGAESSKTRATQFNIFVDNKRLGRFGVKDSKQVEIDAGTYTVSSNFYRDNQLTVTLQPGNTYYLKAIMTKKGNRFQTSYKLVTEDYAFNALPELEEELI